MGVVDTFRIQYFINLFWRKFMKKILILALLVSIISTTSAKETSFTLVKANVNSSSLLSGISTNGIGPFVGFCWQNCTNDYNYCIDHATTELKKEFCSVKLEVCEFGCSISGGFY